MRQAAIRLISLLALGCTAPTAPEVTPAYIGTWAEESLHGNTLTVKKVDDLGQACYAFNIKADGTFIEHKNAGWCATPPISYANFEGTWKARSENKLAIEVAYWGGTETYDLALVSVEETRLVIRRTNHQYQQTSFGPD